MKYDLLIKGGTIVSSDSMYAGCIAIKDQKICGVFSDSENIVAEKTIDACGKYILPGCIDVHVHFRDPGLTYKEDFSTGSMAAAAGGVTTVLDMPNVEPPTITVKNFNEKKEIIKNKSFVNYGIYSHLVNNSSEIEGLIEAGTCGFKWDLSTSDWELPDGYYMPGNDEVAEIFEKIARHGYAVTVHAEDMGLVAYYTKLLRESGRDNKDFLAHVEARPEIVELSALYRTFVLSEMTNCHVHITHLTSARGLDLIKEFKRKGLPITSDVGPSWITFNAEDYAKFGGGIRVVPPIRYEFDREALWNGLAKGDIEVLATDHAPHSNSEKFDRNWWDTLPGTIGVQTSLPLMLDHVNKGDISLTRVVKCMSESPAKIFGLYPRKGCIAVGADADITIVDLNKEWTITHEEMYSKTKFTPYNGFSIKGKPIITIVMGEIVMLDGEIVGTPGKGTMVNPKQSW